MFMVTKMINDGLQTAFGQILKADFLTDWQAEMIIR
jgi:hypothetical protein